MRKIGFKLFTGFLVMALLTVGLLWLIQAVLLKDSYLNGRVRSVSEAIKYASPADYSSLETSLNVSLLAVDSGGNVTYMSQGLPMRGMMMRQMGFSLSEGVQYLPMGGTRYAVVGAPIQDGGALYAVFSLVDVEEASRILLQQLWIITAALLALSLIIALILSRMFSRPILNVTDAARAMAAGRYDVSLPVRSRDEIGQLTSALNELGRELGKTESLRRELIANVSHELRSPLAVIKGFAETVRDVTWPDEKKREQQLTAISQEASRLGDIVGDILDYSRLAAGVDAVSPSEFCLCSALKEITARYEIEAGKRGLSLSLDCPDGLTARFDGPKFSRVMHNLISNALNHAAAGSAVRIYAQTNGSAARISVKNDGSPIPPEELGRIWERYHRADEIKDNRPLGTGLGLSIVKSIADSHGVACGVTSTQAGTVFWFDTLPLQ